MPPKGFLSSLFDLSFQSLITTRVIRVLYGLALAGIGLIGAGLVVQGFGAGPALGAFVLVAAPVTALALAIYARVLLELMLAVFRILDSNEELVRLHHAQSRSEGPAAR